MKTNILIKTKINIKQEPIHSSKILKSIAFLSLIFIILFSIITETKAQEFFDSQGTDFWLTFMPNFHNNKRDTDPRLKFGDSIYIYIASSVPTRGKIEYTDQNNITYTSNFTITDPEEIYTFKLCYYDYELLGFNDNINTIFVRNQCEKVAKQSFHITSEDEVSVYALNQAQMTSDAFLVMPTDVLGNDYYVMTYNSDSRFIANNSKTPSQFVVVAVEDSTLVTIKPSAPTYFYRMNTQNVLLNKGECYLVQALIDEGNTSGDMTGTKITSTKPIAVFAGHQRATVPIMVFAGGNPSRDCLISQMLPVKAWGKNAFLVPYVQEPDIVATGSDLYRILAAYDSTRLYIDSSYIGILNSGEFIEGSLIAPAFVFADKPIMVGQFKKTSKDGGDMAISDPFFMIMPPKEQFMNSYRIINSQSYMLDFDMFPPTYSKVFIKQYIGIVIPDSSKRTVKIDGTSVDPRLFLRIPYSSFSYANVPVNDGVHEVEADDKFGITIYGYGYANSYGYTGGMSFMPYDLQPPNITWKDSCYSLIGFVYDTVLNDTKVKKVNVVEGTKENVEVTIENFKPYKSSVYFNGRLIDNRQDGKFILEAMDSVNQKSSKEIYIPGFTVNNFLSNDWRDIPPTISEEVRFGKTICFPVILYNYGLFPHTISSIKISNNQVFSINKNLPFTINPKQTDTIIVCFSANVDSTFIDSLLISEGCEYRNIAYLDLSTVMDKNKPDVLLTSDECKTIFTAIVSDTLKTDYGIEKIDIIDSMNCRITKEFSPKISIITIETVDIYQDAFFRISIQDSVGHITEINDTIPGLTFGFPLLKSGAKVLDFGLNKIGFLNCDSIAIYNYGIMDKTLDIEKSNEPFVFLHHNILFSIPPDEFPIKLEPYDTAYIKVCFRPLTASEIPMNDTLDLIFGCYNIVIPLTGTGDNIIREGFSKCEVPIKVITTSANESFWLGQNYPNPVIKTTTIAFSLPKPSQISLNIMDLFGNEVKKIAEGHLNEGIYEAQIDCSNLLQGMYFYTLKHSEGIISKYFIISK